MPKRGRRRKKNRTHVVENDIAQSTLVGGANGAGGGDKKVPKSLVIRRGRTAQEVGELITDIRYMMMPYTALNFEENHKNRKLTLQQYSKNLAIPMGITHIISVSQNEERLNMMMARTPDGPTLSFRIHSFSLNKHIKILQKRPVNANAPSMTSNPPIVVTNNFGDHTTDPHIKLMRITFQNLFPQINVTTVKLNDCRRVILFNLLSTDVKDDDGKIIQKQIIHIRQYAIKATPVGINRRVRRLVQAKLPNLHKCNDIADYLEGNAIVQSDAPSDSEAEDDPANVVKLPDKYSGRGNFKSQTSALKLIEMGPRLSLELIKVQKGLGCGDILYHSYIHKSATEATKIKEKVEQEKQLKNQRRSEQERNVEKKRQSIEEKRASKRIKMEQKHTSGMEQLQRDQQQQILDDDDDDDNDNDDDVISTSSSANNDNDEDEEE